MTAIARHHAEWLGLVEVSGPFLTLPVLERVFPQGLDPVEPELVARLRDARDEWVEQQDGEGDLISFVLREVLGFDRESFRDGAAIPADLQAELKEHHETVKPNFAIVNPAGKANPGKARLLVMVWPREQDLDGMVEGGAWAASPAERMTVLCRTTGVRLGLVTNGHRWMLVDAPQGETAGYASWYSHLWLEERLTLRAFVSFLGVRRFFAVADTDTLEQMLHESSAYQEEVTDQLGYQVRRAVEVLVQALDRADLDRDRKLLEGVTPERLYEAGLTVMMRLVFLFCAEERGLLLLGDSTYDDFYAVSTLRGLLREEADRVGLEVLERRQDAWTRLLASFRAVYGGLEHDSLRLSALGGSLFDPDRFPFLEGRIQETTWIDTPALPLPIDNRTVLYLLEALQLLQMKGSSGSKEARRLSFRALDVEQIGYVYEGLLDHVAVRVPGPTLGLIGTKDKEPEVLLSDLENERAKGQDALIEYLKEQTGRSISALKKSLEAEAEEGIEDHLLIACGNDRKLMEQILPYHGLIREDVWGYPQVYRAGSFMVTGGPERRETGTHYTPKSLTEKIVTTTLEPLVYDGPTDGKLHEEWKLRKPAELLDIKICDPAMGSGAFLVQACRWLAERVVEAWDIEEKGKRVITVDGEVLEVSNGQELLPKNRDERITTARRLIAERCLYGVDINHLAVELAKLSIWLVTLAKNRPFGFLDHSLRHGDSLIGIHRLDQLLYLKTTTDDGPQQQRLFGQKIANAVLDAIEIRQRIRVAPVRDICDIEISKRLDREAHDKLKAVELLADAMSGELLLSNGNTRICDLALNSLAMQADDLLSDNEKIAGDVARHARKALSAGLSERKPPRKPFHWTLHFPEVFNRDKYGFDAIVGNPPMLGGRRISYRHSNVLLNYLKSWLVGPAGTTDLCVYFLLRASRLLGKRGFVGFVLSDIVGQGESRVNGLLRLLDEGFTIFSCIPSTNWPGKAGVKISHVHIASATWNAPHVINGQNIKGKINSYLQIAEDHVATETKRLAENEGICYSGHYLMGQGFVITPDDAARLISIRSSNRNVIFPLIRGDDINNKPDQTSGKFAINFSMRSLEVCKREFPECLEIVKSKVKPERDLVKRKSNRERWWRYAEARPGLEKAIRGLEKVIVQPFTAKYIFPTFVNAQSVFAHPIVVIVRPSYFLYACLQSSIHELWVWQFCSTSLDLLRYTANTVLATFPFPKNVGKIEILGEEYYSYRQSLIAQKKIGLTDLYNQFHNPDNSLSDIQRLRTLHANLNVAILHAYGWHDIDSTHAYDEVVRLPAGKNKRFTINGMARAEILRRLVRLNQERDEAAGACPAEQES